MPSSLTRVLSFVLGFSPRPPASVCGTGTLTIISAFSCQRGFACFPTFNFGPHHGSALRGTYFTIPRPNRLDRLYHQPAHAILLRQRVTHKGGTGISTSCPSPTTVVLGLGPDLPWADEPSPGNLGLSTAMFLALLSLLIPAFSLLYSPRLLPLPLQPVHYAPLPLTCIYTAFRTAVFQPRRTIWRIALTSASGCDSQSCNFRFSSHAAKGSVDTCEPEASVVCFSPVTSSAHNHSTSELLRTL